MFSRLLLLFCCLLCLSVAFFVPAPIYRANCELKATAPGQLVPDDDEESPDGSTEIDGIIFEGDFEDDSVKPSLTTLLDIAVDEAADSFRLDTDDSLFQIPDYVPSELPDLAAIGSGLEGRRGAMGDFAEGEFDPNDEKMAQLLNLKALDEKKTRVSPEDFKPPGSYIVQEARAEAGRKYRTHERDTGSTTVQVAQLTQTVNYLTKHMQAHPTDYSSRRGLLRAVNLRRRLLNYAAQHDKVGAVRLAGELGVRFRPPEAARSKFDMYRFFKNTKSKKAKNMQALVQERVESKAEA